MVVHPVGELRRAGVQSRDQNLVDVTVPLVCSQPAGAVQRLGDLLVSDRLPVDYDILHAGGQRAGRLRTEGQYLGHAFRAVVVAVDLAPETENKIWDSM